MRIVVRREWVIESPEAFRLATHEETKNGAYWLRKEQFAQRVCLFEAPLCNIHPECWDREMGKACIQHEPHKYEVRIWVRRDARKRSREWATKLSGQLAWTLFVFGEFFCEHGVPPGVTPLLYVPPFTVSSLGERVINLVRDVGDEGYGRHAQTIPSPAR
jgi:hypothetical protein